MRTETLCELKESEEGKGKGIKYHEKIYVIEQECGRSEENCIKV
jgi:hypothetical protein